jgi:hypothetical protein
VSVSSSACAKVIAACLAISAFSLSAAFAQVGVNVNGNPMYLNPGPIEKNGRVYVPLRGIFEHLGAGVSYNNGVINATKGNQTVQLRIGSTQANVNGQIQHLDAAPFIVGSTTYVPLRFVAQSFGANVGYNCANRQVSIDLAGPPAPVVPPRPVNPPQPYIPPPPRVSVTHLRGQQPAPGAIVQNTKPRIAAEFTHRVNPGSLNVTIDDSNVTGWAQRDASAFAVTPRTALWVGTHTVRVTGNDASGAYFDRAWEFRVSAPPPPAPSNVQLRNQHPVPSARNPNPQPRISADFTAQVNPSTIGVRIDGTEVTGWTERNAWSFAVTPRNPLNTGEHTVRVWGNDLRGVRFERQWSFATVAAQPTPAPTTAPTKPHLNLSQPTPNQVVPLTFAVKGNTVANGRVDVVAGANPGGAANFSGATVAGPYGNFTVNVTLKIMPGQQTANLTVTATNPVNGQTVEKRMPVRLMQPR